MDDQALEQRIRTAAEHAAPDVLDRVLSSCGKQKGQVISLNKQKRFPRALQGLVAACLLLVLAGGGAGFWYWQANAVASIISLDVNPSIELRVNRNERVLSCTPLNADAAQVLFEMDDGRDLEGAKLDVAVNAIVGALVRHGYLDSISSALLISVEDSDQDRAGRLQQELTGTVTALLEQQSSAAAVYSQSITQDASLNQIAQANNISNGKAALINQVLALNSALTFDQLTALSVEELEQLVKSGAPGMPIGMGEAQRIAEEYAGTLELSSVTADVDPELDERSPHYEVELYTSFGKFEYKVDAYTGAILSGQRDILNTQPAAPSGTPDTPAAPDASASPDTSAAPETPAASASPSTPDAPAAPSSTPSAAPSTPAVSSGNSLIGEESAKSYALAHAGCGSTDWIKCYLEYDHGSPECYEVEFEADGCHYKYEIDCYSGAVIKHECASLHHDDEHHGNGNHGSGQSTSTGTPIGEEAAKTAAFTHAGVSASDVRSLKVKLDTDDGVTIYEVEFKSGNMEYEYEIDAYSGAVLKWEAEWDD